MTGLTDRYFYEHFANRDELLVAVADEVRDQLLRALVEAGVSNEGSTRAKLQAALQAFLDTIDSDPYLHRIVTTDPSGVCGLMQRRAEMLNLIVEQVIHHALGSLGIDADQLRRTALFITGGVNQLIESWLDGQIATTTAELAADSARMCIDVIANASP